MWEESNAYRILVVKTSWKTSTLNSEKEMER